MRNDESIYIGLSTLRNRVVQRGVTAVVLVAVSLFAVGASGAFAQPTMSAGAECTSFDADALLAVTVAGDHDVIVLYLADGTSASFSDVVDGQVVDSPNGTPIIGMQKCDVPDAPPEPTPTPTVEPTVVPEPTAEPTVEPTTEPAPTQLPATPTPENQVLERSQERSALAQTGIEAWAVAVVGLALLGAGALLLH